MLWDVLEAIAVSTSTPGVTRRRPQLLLADRGYAHNSTRSCCAAAESDMSFPRRDQIAYHRSRGPRGGPPPSFDRQAYKRRNVVGRCFNRLKQWRDLATRYAKRAAIYQASLTIAAIMTWIR